MYRNYLILVCLLIITCTSIQAQDIDSKIDNIKYAMMNGNFEDGLEQCKNVIELNISDTKQLSLVYGYAGLSSEALGNKDDAIRYYKEAVRLEVPQLDIYDKLINLSKKAKNDSIYEFALLEKAKSYPEYKESIDESLAFLYVNTEQYEKLLTTTDELLKLNPTNTDYLYFKGIAYQNLNQIDKAKALYNEVLKLNPDHPGANMSIGMILYSDGTQIFALRKKEYEAKSKPSRSDYSVYNKGIEEGKNLYRQALPHLLKAYKSGSYPSLKQILFNTYARLEQKEKADAYK